MTELRSFFSVILLFFLIVGCNGRQSDTVQTGSSTDHQAPEMDEPELAVQMAYIQQYSHKLALSIDGENREAAEFYLHELEERIEQTITEVPEYEGYAIAELMETMLEPTLEPIDQQVEAGNWDSARQRMQDMIRSCNSCHQSTDHTFIQVTAGFDTNPYNQIFKKQ